MAAKRKNNVTLEKLTHEYKSPSNYPFDTSTLSFNRIAVLAAVLVLLAGACVNRLVTKSWQEWNVYLVVITILLAAASILFGTKFA